MIKNNLFNKKQFVAFISIIVAMLWGTFSYTLAQSAEFAGGDDFAPAFSAAIPDGWVGTQQPIERKRYLKERSYLIPSNHVVAAYYPTWVADKDRNFAPSQVPVEQLSDIIIAYGAICGRNIVAYRQGARISRSCENPSGFNSQSPDRNLGWYYLPEFMGPLKENEAVLVDNTELYFNQEFVSQHGSDRGLIPAMIDWKNRNPNLKVHWAIGGWSYSGPFYKMTASSEARGTFISSLKKWLSQPVMHFIDGISIDWEAPGGGAADGDLGNPSIDGRNLVLLIQELRQMLDELGGVRNRRYYLSVGLAAGSQKLHNFRNSASVGNLLSMVSQLRLLTYDFFGNWGDIIGFNTALTTPDMSGLSLDDLSLSSELSFSDSLTSEPPQETQQDILSVSNILNILSKEHNVSVLNKVLLGVPFYGRTHGRTSEQDANQLPGAAKTSRGASRYTVEPGIVSYFDLFQNYLGEDGRGVAGWEPYYYPDYEAGLLWNRSSGEVISYAPPRAMKAFIEFVKQYNLGGISSWGIDEDNGLLLNAIHEAYGHSQIGMPPPEKRWIYAPLCKESEISKHITNGQNLLGLTFSNGSNVYQVQGPIMGCPNGEEQTPSIGWRFLGSVKAFELPLVNNSLVSP